MVHVCLKAGHVGLLGSQPIQVQEEDCSYLLFCIVRLVSGICWSGSRSVIRHVRVSVVSHWRELVRIIFSWHDQPEQMILIIAMSATAEKESHRDRRLCCNLEL